MAVEEGARMEWNWLLGELFQMRGERKTEDQRPERGRGNIKQIIWIAKGKRGRLDAEERGHW